MPPDPEGIEQLTCRRCDGFSIVDLRELATLTDSDRYERLHPQPEPRVFFLNERHEDTLDE